MTLGPRDPGPSAGADLPTVPGGDLSHSPGTTLRFRLPPAASPGDLLARAGCAAVFSIVVLVIFGLFVGGFPRAPLDRGPGIFLLPLGLVCLAMIVRFVRQLLITLGVGPTVVEVSAHPLRPGERCE